MRAKAVSVLIAALLSTAVLAEEEAHFDIVRFQVSGNTLLPEAEVQRIVAPYVGRHRVYGDVQRALEALEAAYRKAGYGTVQVFVPEQELTSGIVQFLVTEAVVGKVTVSGNKHFDEANVRAGLPALQEGKAPNMRELSENIQLSNENPAKQVEVTLGVGQEEGKVDAKVGVTEQNPERVFFTLDNTGTGPTGKYRLGAAYQNANLFNRDQTLTLAYTTSPDKPESVKVDIFSIGYRVPLYAIGDSLDFVYGNSNVNLPSTSPTLGGLMTLNGKGTIAGLRWNHYFPRRGEYSAKLVVGLDYKYMNTRCADPITNAPFAIDPPTPANGGCTPYTTRPLSATYSGQKVSPGTMLDYSLGVAHNWSLGTNYAFRSPNGAVGTDHYSAINQARPTPDDFTVLKAGGSYLHALAGDWQLRVAASAQYSGSPLPASEQFGLAGSTAVRGFNERAVAMDKGWFANLEFYSPELATQAGLSGSLRALAFYDIGSGYNYATSRPFSYSTPVEKASIASLGAGLRYSLRKDFSLRLDFAQVVDAGPVNVTPGTGETATVNPSNTDSRGDWRGHLSLSVGF